MPPPFPPEMPLDWIALAAYAACLAVATTIVALARLARIPAGPVVLAAGLLLGRTGFEVLPASEMTRVLPGIHVHIAIVLGALGHRLGRGMLRLPAWVVVGRSLPPVLLTVGALLAGTALLPLLLADAEPGRSFGRFLLPLSFVFAAFPLLSLRDLRGHAPQDAGSIYLVAVLLFGAVYSFTPSLLWMRPFDPSVFWRGPLLVLGESGALGVGLAVFLLLLVRRLRLPRVPTLIVVFLALAEACFRFDLWLPFAALGAGIVLGRTGEPGLRVPRHGAIFSEAPFLLLGGWVFAPDLFRATVAGPALLHGVWLVVLLLAIRLRFPGGRHLVTGPGFLFLGLALTVRLDGNMGPLTRYTIDFALPAWVMLRGILWGLRRGEARGGGGADAIPRAGSGVGPERSTPGSSGPA